MTRSTSVNEKDDKRGKAAALNGLTEKVNMLTLSNGEEELQRQALLLRPLRTTEGSTCEGNSIALTVNHFHVTVKKNDKLIIYHYDVTITPADNTRNFKKTSIKPKSMDCQDNSGAQLPDRLLPMIWDEFELMYGKEVKKKVAMPFDGKKNCYTVEKLDLGNQIEKYWLLVMKDPEDDDKERTFFVRLKYTNDIDPRKFTAFMNSRRTRERVDLPQDVIQAYDVALRWSPANNYFCCNRSFFSNQKPYCLDAFLDLFYGHYQSLTTGSDVHPTLNIDLANKAFVRRMPLIPMLCKLFNCKEKELDEKFWDSGRYCRATELLAGKLVEYGTGKKDPVTGVYEKTHKFPAVEFLKYTANSFKFSSTSGQVNIAEYFLKEKNTKIYHGNIPVLHIGSKSKTNYVPIELCIVTEQPYKGKMEPTLTSAMIKGAAKAPSERFQRIKTAREGCHFEKCHVLKAFGLSVASQPVFIQKARHLNPPNIQTKGFDVQPDLKTGSWSMKNRKFFKAADVPKYAVLDAIGISKGKPIVVSHFFTELCKEASNFGLNLKPNYNLVTMQNRCPNPAYNNHEHVKRFVNELDNTIQQLKSSKHLLIFVIISDDGREYPSVKALSEVKIGILTSCIKSKTLHGNFQTLGNILLKLNTKLGGINFQLSHKVMEEFFAEPVLVMGADVTHPAPNSNAPSFAAVTASIGLNGMSFCMHIQAQNSKQEIISNLRAIAGKMLRKFKDCTERVPLKILMFRDGVSEGYFDAIKEHEYLAIKEACLDMGSGYKPRITFVVVKKRHHTRFCPQNPSRDGVGKPMNVPPGTIVDSVITHPVEQEFFLNSHVGIQGTSKPTRYHVIHDDCMFTMDQIQKLSYFLCYMYVRCCQPVSYPAPTYYAHLAAFRARTLVNSEGDNADLTALSKSLTIHPDLLRKYPMFFV